MLNLGQLKVGKAISFKEKPFVIVSAKHVVMGRGGAVVKTKLKNLIDGSTAEETFKSGGSVEEADLSRTKAQFMYAEGEEYYFMDETSFEQFPLPKDQVGEITNYIKEGQTVDVLNYESKPVALSLPPKVNLKVTEAPPGVRGDTAQGTVTKQVILETGYVVNTPLFIKKGDTLRINTESGEYVERV